MANIASIMNHIHPQAASVASPAATPSASKTSSSSSDGSNISSTDFLTLLVTELKNQDPTANADPNAYVNQLVSVNSLQQLIQINQTLTAKQTSGSAVGQSVSGTSPSNGMHGVPVAPSNSHVPVVGGPVVASGNLSTPAANPAAQSVAQALGGNRHHRL